MRGWENPQGKLFYHLNPEEMIPSNHPIRQIRAICDQALDKISPQLDSLYAEGGKPSVPPERLLRAMVIQKIYMYMSSNSVTEMAVFTIAIFSA